MALLKPAALQRLDPQATYRFCASPDCLVVYYAPGHTFEKDHLSVRVFQKERDPATLVCYCFGYTLATIASAPTAALADINKLVKQGRCACELRNPQGTCCLGNIKRLAAACGQPRQPSPAGM